LNSERVCMPRQSGNLQIKTLRCPIESSSGSMCRSSCDLKLFDDGGSLSLCGIFDIQDCVVRVGF
jgi:hypothetical protein